jgi:hypothetical protein
MTEEDRANVMQVKKYQDYMSAGMESCLGKTTLAGVFGTPCFSLSHLTYLFFKILHQVSLPVDSFR